MENEQFQREKPLLYVVFIVIGILLVVISFLLRSLHKNAILADVSLNVGASLISTAGIAFLYERFGTNKLANYLGQLLRSFSITQRAIELGIQEMWGERRQIPNGMWNTFTAAGGSEVWLLGMAELGFAEDPKFGKIVSEGTGKGCNYRFLLLDPDSVAATEIDEKEGGLQQLQGRIRRAIQKFSGMQFQNQNKKGRVEVRLYSNVPQVSIIRSDDDFLITPYMFYHPGDSSFTLRIRKTPDGIYEHYIKFFEEIWERAHPPAPKPKK